MIKFDEELRERVVLAAGLRPDYDGELDLEKLDIHPECKKALYKHIARLTLSMLNRENAKKNTPIRR